MNIYVHDKAVIVTGKAWRYDKSEKVWKSEKGKPVLQSTLFYFLFEFFPVKITFVQQVFK
jgi:hypothetical protein